jgi:V/A-type H+-transporting ATPase subunit E
MPLDALQKEILDDAQKRAEAVEAKAKKEADAIVKEARAKADEADKAFERELADEMARIGLEYKSLREMQERNLLVSAKEKLLDDLVEKVRESVIKRARERGYKKLFDAAISEAEKISPMKDLTIVMDKDDAKYARSFTGKVKYGAVDGLVIYAGNGRIKIDATLGTLFDRNREAIKEAIRRSVFGERKKATARKPARASKPKRKAARSSKRKPAKKAARKAAKPKRKRK